jgi:hypothetical protein
MSNRQVLSRNANGTRQLLTYDAHGRLIGFREVRDELSALTLRTRDVPPVAPLIVKAPPPPAPAPAPPPDDLVAEAMRLGARGGRHEAADDLAAEVQRLAGMTDDALTAEFVRATLLATAEEI